MTPKRTPAIAKAADKAHFLDAETRAMISGVKKKNSIAVAWFLVSWSVLLVVGVSGIVYQNTIANANKRHIDCIVKLLATPLPQNARSRTLSNPSTSCNINFVQ